MRASRHSFYRWLALGFAAGALLLCLPAAWAARGKDKTEQFARVWPLPPDPPRVAYVKSITQPGDAGVKLSEIGLGGWLTFGNAIEQQQAIDVMNAAFERGINFFDSANAYARGRSEEAWGEILKDRPRSRDALIGMSSTSTTGMS